MCARCACAGSLSRRSARWWSFSTGCRCAPYGCTSTRRPLASKRCAGRITPGIWEEALAMRDTLQGSSRSAVPPLRRAQNAAVDAVPALAAGLVASLAATALMLLLRLAAGVVTLPELVGERVLPELDAGTF